MKHTLVSVLDRAVEAYGPVFQVRAKGEALRNFQDAVNNPENKQLHDHPEDYELHLLGYFDDSTGLIERLDKPECLSRGTEVKKVLQLGRAA